MTDTIFIPTLFDEVKATHRRLTHAEAWDRFRHRNPWFMPRAAELAYQMREQTGRVSTKTIFELLRPEVIESGSPYKLDNSFTSHCADRLCADYPDLERSIVRRKRSAS